MNGKLLFPAALGLAALGCAPTEKPPAAVVPIVPPAISPIATKTPSAPAAIPVALVEPYLIPYVAPVASPPPLGGRALPPLPIQPLPGAAPIEPATPTQVVPVQPGDATPSRPTPIAPVPKRPPSLPPAVVKLLEEERARSVAEARDRLSAASARATQTAAEAKKQWGYVKEGFVAQKQAENADAAAKDAAADQADAQKALDDAQRRQGDTRRDLQRAFGLVAATPESVLVALQKPIPAYQAVPFTYRLSIVGATTTKPTVQNGTIARLVPASPGEAAAWIVRCPDPTRLRVGVGGRAATVVVRSLPSTEITPKA